MFSIITGIQLFIAATWPARQIPAASLVALGVAVTRERAQKEAYKRKADVLKLGLGEDGDTKEVTLQQFSFAEGALPDRLSFLYGKKFYLTGAEKFTLKSAITAARAGQPWALDWEQLVAVSKARLKERAENQKRGG